MKAKKDFLQSIQGNWTQFHIKVTINSKNILLRPKFHSSKQVIQFIKEVWDEDLIGLQEQMIAVYLNRSNRLLGYRLISTGNDHQILVDVKLIVCLALQCMASKVIIVHNHPSNSLMPSMNDSNLTVQVQTALRLLEIRLEDHLIIGPDGDYLSMMDNGLL